MSGKVGDLEQEQRKRLHDRCIMKSFKFDACGMEGYKWPALQSGEQLISPEMFNW